ncbi:MAG: HD domain-containing protein [Clostridia bacterium]|nr:HD domain-containing protein [Clostridia bacterium]
MKNDIQLANQIAQKVARLGGRAYFVGGCVRDGLLGIECADIDIEVHGLAPAALEEILDSVGRRMEVGKSFGIYALKGHSLDIALPRKERAVGHGHRDFKISVDPHIGTCEAAKRRDFTIGALMQDVLTGEIVDHFGGLQDLKKGILRHVDDNTFSEDPLRVLRGAQFAARFEMKIAEETLKLCKAIQLDTISKERILGELSKALMSADRPSLFFAVLKEMEQLDTWFGELGALIDVKQNKKYHAEGDAWSHTLLVLDEAAKLRCRANYPLWFMLSALCHDFGKAITTKEADGRIISYRHETEGLPLVKRFLKRLTNEQKLIQYVLNMTELHMRPHALAAQNASAKAANRMFDKAICPEDLLLLAEADNMGRFPRPEQDRNQYLYDKLRAYQVLSAKPQVTGTDLIAAGLTPDKDFSALLEYAHKLHLSGVDKSTALKQVINYHKKKIK